MATTKATLGSILEMFTQTAGMITNIVTTASDGVDMANRFVESASIDQKDRHIIHRKTFRDDLLRQSRLTVAKADEEVLNFIKSNDTNAQLYAKAETYLPDDIFVEKR